MAITVDDLDGQALADAVVANRAALLETECRELVLAAQWADVHPAESLEPRRVLPGMERPRRFGGDGTPEAGEFAAAELGVLMGRSHVAAANLMADALDLRHRLPLLWAAVLDGSVHAWQARHVASRTRITGLTLEQARSVDTATTPYLATLTWGRFTDLLEARIIAADPAAAEARREAAELDRFVTTGQSSDHGLKTLIARATAGEVIYLVAMVDRIAQILELEGDESSIGVRRSKALGLLAHPARALALLRNYEPSSVVEERACEASSVVEERACERLETTIPDSVPLPPAVLYVHVSRDSLETGDGVARMEGVGPITIGQASEFLRHSHVTVKPVIDLETEHPADGYEVPARLRELLHLRRPASAFPWSSATSRRMDVDHTTPYVDSGPPGQTRIGNLGKLTRFEHRTKTHGPGWRHRQPRPGVHLWRTPSGYEFRVDHTGTHPLGRPRDLTPMERAFARAVASAHYHAP